ncbi:MAG: hypothetical protein M0R06_11740 [Sphaerochaeta sp.]|jgi:hypothetical protein|nr:hypothetical protein [Sphaerochaeta sp.]
MPFGSVAGTSDLPQAEKPVEDEGMEFPDHVKALPPGTVLLTVSFVREDRDGVQGITVDYQPAKSSDDEFLISPYLGIALLEEALATLREQLAPFDAMKQLFKDVLEIDVE